MLLNNKELILAICISNSLKGLLKIILCVYDMCLSTWGTRRPPRSCGVHRTAIGNGFFPWWTFEMGFSSLDLSNNAFPVHPPCCPYNSFFFLSSLLFLFLLFIYVFFALEFYSSQRQVNNDIYTWVRRLG